MSSRLNQEREAKLQPKRMNMAIITLAAAGVLPSKIDETSLFFLWKGERVTYFPYSGWATGKSILDGRGLKNLLKQLR